MKVKCNNCGLIHEVHIDWQDVGSDDRQMGPEVFYDSDASIECECGRSIEIHLEGSEYPIGDGIRIYANDVKNGEIL